MIKRWHKLAVKPSLTIRILKTILYVYVCIQVCFPTILQGKYNVNSTLSPKTI